MARKDTTPSNLPTNAREELVGFQQVNRRSNRHKSEHADYSTADASLLLNTVAKVTARGDGIQFGLTKEGSTFTIRCVGTVGAHTDYVRPSEDINAYLKALADDYTELGREELDYLLRGFPIP